MSQGAETSGGGWRVEGGGKVQVDSVPLRRRMWGAGDIKSGVRLHLMLPMGGAVGGGGGNNMIQKATETDGAGGADRTC